MLHTLGILHEEPSWEDPSAIITRLQGQQQLQHRSLAQVDRATITETLQAFPVITEQQQQQNQQDQVQHKDQELQAQASGWHSIQFQPLDVQQADGHLHSQPTQAASQQSRAHSPQPSTHAEPARTQQQASAGPASDVLRMLSSSSPADQLAAIISAAATAATQAAAAMLAPAAARPSQQQLQAAPWQQPAARGRAMEPASPSGSSPGGSPTSLRVELSQGDGRVAGFGSISMQQHDQQEQQQGRPAEPVRVVTGPRLASEASFQDAVAASQQQREQQEQQRQPSAHQQHSLRGSRGPSTAVLNKAFTSLQQAAGELQAQGRSSSAWRDPHSPESPSPQRHTRVVITSSPPPPRARLPPELAHSVQQTLHIIHGHNHSPQASPTAGASVQGSDALPAEDLQMHTSAVVSVRQLLGGTLDYSGLRSELHQLSSAAQMLASHRSRPGDGSHTPRRSAGVEDDLQAYTQVGQVPCCATIVVMSPDSACGLGSLYAIGMSVYAISCHMLCLQLDQLMAVEV